MVESSVFVPRRPRGKNGVYRELLFYNIVLWCAVFVMCSRSGGAGVLGARMGRNVFTLMTLGETSALVMLAPLLALYSLQRHGRTAVLVLFRSALPAWAIVRAWGGLPVLCLAGMSFANMLPAGYLSLAYGGVSPGDIVLVSGLQLLFALCALALGLLCVSCCRDAYTALGVVYLVLAGLMSGVVLTGPLIRSVSQAEPLVQTVLLGNPLMSVAAALDFDLLRTEWLYRLSPLGQRHFVYPAWYTGACCALLVTAVLLTGTLWRVDYLRCHLETWRK